MVLVRFSKPSSRPSKTRSWKGGYTTTLRPCGSSKSSSPSIGGNPGLAQGPHEKKYHTGYGSEGHDDHADLIKSKPAVLGRRRTLVDHLEHGVLLVSRPLPRAWRLTNGGIMMAAGWAIGKRGKRLEPRVAASSAAAPSGQSCGETATFPGYTVALISEMSSAQP